MTKRSVTMVLGSALILAGSMPAWGDGVVNGKATAYSSISGVAVLAPFLPVTSATIAKGKKKRVLEVDATAVESSNVAQGIALQVDVNGLAMEPPVDTFGSYQVAENCGAALTHCTSHGQWWLDLDANPVLLNTPLVVTLSAAGDIPVGITASFSLRVRMLKK